MLTSVSAWDHKLPKYPLFGDFAKFNAHQTFLLYSNYQGEGKTFLQVQSQQVLI